MKLALGYLLLFLPLTCIRAQEAPATPPAVELPAATDAAYQRFRGGTQDLRTLAEVLPLMANPEHRKVIRTAIIESKTPPREALVSLLQHPSLAVRLGTLELLEELNDGDFSYNPWLPADSPENTASHARWKLWAGEPDATRRNTRLFSDDQRRGYLQDLLGTNPDKASRARRMLEAEGLSAVGYLESFLSETKTLTSANRAAIREAQYQITLSRQFGDQATTTAHQLTFGNRDQLLTSLGTIRSCGQLALPILRDFISHPDPLVRETAIDSLLLSGGEQAVPIVAPLLATEADVNVIHGALRRLKDIPGPETDKLITTFLSHPDEDLLVSAVQTAISLGGSRNSSRFSSSSDKPRKTADIEDAVVKLLSDPRWRVRASALEYVAKHKPSKSKATCIALLNDSDEFVRFAAIAAVTTLEAKEALPNLKALLLKDEQMIGPVIESMNKLGRPPDAEVTAHLRKCSPEVKLAALRALSSSDDGPFSSSDKDSPLIYEFAADSNIDLACAALRTIAASESLNKIDKGAGALIAALKSGSIEKREAILERITLASTQDIDSSIMETIHLSDKSDSPTTLDPLYDAFLNTDKELASAPSTHGTKPKGTQQELFIELTKLVQPEIPLSDRFRAALNLAKAGQAAGYTALIRDLPQLTTAQKISIGETIYRPSTREALKLIAPLLADPVPEVRKAAAECALGNDKARTLIEMTLAELSRPGALLKPTEIYGSRFDSSMRESSNGKLVRAWVSAVLNSEKSSNELKILAMIAASSTSTPAIVDSLRTQCKSADRNVRRAAWRALLTTRPAEINAENAAAIAADRDAFVREVLPNRTANVQQNYWVNRFSDSQVARDEHWSYNDKKTRVPVDVLDILRKLATKDPTPKVRFEASFALLTQGSNINIDEFIALLPLLPKDSTYAKERISYWLSSNAERATPALAPLLQVVDTSSISADSMKTLQKRIHPNPTKEFASFGAIAENANTTTATKQPLLTPEVTTPNHAPRKSLDLVFFYKPGCPECAKAKREFDKLTKDFPLLKVAEYNILDPRGIVLNQALCARFTVPSVNQSVSPAIFTQAGFLIRDQITPKSMAELLAKTMPLPQDNAWLEISTEETTVAATEVTQRYKSLTPTVVILGGLLDGVNPCAFATIIFFLSYLQIARRTPREMLMVGAAFISAVFIAYLAAGLLLHGVIGTLVSRFAGIQRWMNIGFAALALIAAILSFRDAWLARHGRLGEMSLQLPDFLKSRIRSVIRTGTKARNFVIAAFISGLIISLLELACTGQVYAPIIYQIQQGQMDAVLWLVIYNLAFIAPLIVIFFLAYGGMRSEKLIAIQRDHTTIVKIALGLVFVALALVILLGKNL